MDGKELGAELFPVWRSCQRRTKRSMYFFFFLCPVLKSFLREKRGEGEEDERIGLPNGAGSVG